ncbi:MAG: hypothetical protein QME76_10145 [Bacillota bacterium]|nr:hypothetical protein [Bacillota bacterium]
MAAIEWYVPSLGTPTVALAEYGLNLNLGAYSALGEPPGVRLGLDRTQKYILIQPLMGTENEIKKDGLPVRVRAGNIRVNGRDFVRFVQRYFPELRPSSRAVRYLAWWSDEDGFLVVDLNQPVESGRQDGDDDENE